MRTKKLKCRKTKKLAPVTSHQPQPRSPGEQHVFHAAIEKYVAMEESPAVNDVSDWVMNASIRAQISVRVRFHEALRI
jgi:hypothetical protein